jgi:uncharacterized protein (AIM24 family)
MAISYVTAASLDGTQNGSAPIYGARAWVNFNGTGTVAIRASGNVSSITDNGAGDYTVNFTTAMADANYSGSLTTGDASGTSLIASTYNFVAAPTSSAWRILTFTRAAGTVTDSPYVFAAIFR